MRQSSVHGRLRSGSGCSRKSSSGRQRSGGDSNGQRQSGGMKRSVRCRPSGSADELKRWYARFERKKERPTPVARRALRGPLQARATERTFWMLDACMGV